ncbi:hypothetical protein RJ729_11380 [Acinetobacter pittii]
MGQVMTRLQQPFIGPPMTAKTYSRYTRWSNKANASLKMGEQEARGIIEK